MKSIHKKTIVFAITLFVLIIAVLLILISFRGGTQYEGELAALLPPDTIAYARLHNFSGLYDQIAATERFETWNEDYIQRKEDTSSSLASWAEKWKLKLGWEFFRRWFGKEVAVALLPGESPQRPGLILFADTDIGFEENLAEVIAQLFPSFNLSSAKYKGIPITLYKAEKKRHSFCYTRFGKTIVFSFRSPDTSFIKRIIDYRKKRQKKTLLDADVYVHTSAAAAIDTYLSAFAQPEKTARAIIELMMDNPDSSINDTLSTSTVLSSLSRYSLIRLGIGYSPDFKGEVNAFMNSRPENMGYESLVNLSFIQKGITHLYEDFGFLVEAPGQPIRINRDDGIHITINHDAVLKGIKTLRKEAVDGDTQKRLEKLSKKALSWSVFRHTDIQWKKELLEAPPFGWQVEQLIINAYIE